jgi:hypothetical protein
MKRRIADLVVGNIATAWRALAENTLAAQKKRPSNLNYSAAATLLAGCGYPLTL